MFSYSIIFIFFVLHSSLAVKVGGPREQQRRQQNDGDHELRPPRIEEVFEYPRVVEPVGAGDSKTPSHHQKLTSRDKFGAARVWLAWKMQHDKLYETNRDEMMRFENFASNYQYVQEHNDRYRSGAVSYDIALNRYADMTADEVKTVLNGFQPNKQRQHRQKYGGSLKAFEKSSVFELSDEVDWRPTAVTHVKDQGMCGCCWACSTTGALEGQYYMKAEKLIVLSEQNLIDCSKNYGNEGCQGGFMDNAFQYVKEQGIEKEADYPFEGRDAKCRFKKEKALDAKVTSYVDIPSGDENALAEAVARYGPISVAIDASHRSFQLYTEGVYMDPHCGNDTNSLDHAVLLVGYGKDEKTGHLYWLVKNSWSPRWGEHGYFRMARNHGNMCGIATMASYPELEIGATPPSKPTQKHL